MTIEATEILSEPTGTHTPAKILLLTAEHTGLGHLAVSGSLKEAFEAQGDVVAEIDFFHFAGGWATQLSRFYNVMVQGNANLWKTIYRMSGNSRKSGVAITSTAISHSLNKFVDSFEPDAIISAHSMATNPVIHALEKKGKHIPVFVMQADLASIHRTWCNPKATMTFCTNESAKQQTLACGVSPDKIKVVGYPVRSTFQAQLYPPKKQDGKIRCLLMGGGSGAGNIRQNLAALLSIPQVQVTVVCGKNVKLRRLLEQEHAAQIKDGRARIMGRISTMPQELAQADIAVLRAGPNSIMEAVNMHVPIIVTGALPGQEEKNPQFVQDSGLGVMCLDPQNMRSTVEALLANDQAELKRIRKTQEAFTNTYTPVLVAQLVHEYLDNTTSTTR